MKNSLFLSAMLLMFSMTVIFTGCTAQPGAEPWKPHQLMPTAELARVINDPKAKKPMIISIGPSAIIKGSIDMGAAGEKQNLDNLKSKLSGVPRNTDIVLYCGCCPFRNCPNIRPAFNLLNKMQFTNHKLLDVPQNIKVDWIDKKYPVE